MTMKTELWWASIGGHKCEPIRVMVRDEDGPVHWFSIGCADPHPIGPGMVLVEIIEDFEIPPRPQDAAKQRKQWEREHRQPGAGYRRFD
jgi:hypothetical protein